MEQSLLHIYHEAPRRYTRYRPKTKGIPEGGTGELREDGDANNGFKYVKGNDGLLHFTLLLHPVNPRVNSARNEDADLIEAFENPA